MTRRSIIISMAILTLCLLGGSIMYMLHDDHTDAPSFAPQQSKTASVKASSPRRRVYSSRQQKYSATGLQNTILTSS